MNLLTTRIIQNAKTLNKTIVLPESSDDRILKATEYILKEKIAKIILVGEEEKIRNQIKKLNLQINYNEDNLTIESPKTSSKTKTFEDEFFKLRETKGITKEDAIKTIQRNNYFGTMLVQMNNADGMVTGAIHPTADSIRPALQIIKTQSKFHKVSGVFFMELKKKLLLFADSAITIEPTAKDLANTALDTAQTAITIGITPKIALLSFSTKGSAQHESINKIRQAVKIVQTKNPKLIIDGELQLDSALNPKIAKRKCPNSPIKGDANILIFPSLESGNIAYKIVEQLAGATATGPILQGLNKPINDLSRGCDYMDIVNVVAFTCVQSENNKIIK